MTDHALKAEDLRQFTGTEQWYRHSLARSVTYTDGAKYVADKGGAYWLLDEIAINGTMKPKLQREEFQVWKLTKNKLGHGAKLTVEDGNGNKLWTKRIGFTDFPLPEITLWFVNKVIHLPSEY